MSTSFGFGQSPSRGGFGHSKRRRLTTATEETSFSQPTSTSSISKQKHPTTEVEESKAIVAGLTKMEQIIADCLQNINKFGITEDLETEKNYIKNIKFYTDLVEENIKKKAHMNRTKFQSMLDKLSSFITSR